MELHPAGAPESPLFLIKQTPFSGRGVFAKEDILAGTPLPVSDDLSVHVVFREYRREICAQCFAYDRGVEWKVRDGKHGFVFCSDDCQARWRAEAGEIGMAAWAAAEKLIKNRSKEDIELVDIDCPKPTTKEINTAWAAAEKQAELILLARHGSTIKSHRKAMQHAISAPVSADVLPLLVSTVLVRHHNPHAWKSLLTLSADSLPYKSSEELTIHVNSYLHLLAILPTELLVHVTPSTFITLLTRDSHNSFGIRSLDDGGSEYFGYGVWPAASYYNHSCDPNVGKLRVGRLWKFYAARHVAAGEELCITYLNNEEREMSRGQRMERLERYWGFECRCERCRDL